MRVNRQYAPELRAEAVKQALERDITVVAMATRIGLPRHTLCSWVQSARKSGRAANDGAAIAVSDSAEIRRLKAELRRVT